jgi:hypothetical protein
MGTARWSAIHSAVLIELEVGAGTFAMRLPARGVSRLWLDSITVRDQKLIVGAGEAPVDLQVVSPEQTAGNVVTRSALGASTFDPVLATAMVRYGTYQVLRDAGLGRRFMFTGPNLHMRHPGWRDIPPADRRSFLEDLGWPNVEVNDVVVVRQRIRIPLIGAIIGGRWISPNGA